MVQSLLAPWDSILTSSECKLIAICNHATGIALFTHPWSQKCDRPEPPQDIIKASARASERGGSNCTDETAKQPIQDPLASNGTWIPFLDGPAWEGLFFLPIRLIELTSYKLTVSGLFPFVTLGITRIGMGNILSTAEKVKCFPSATVRAWL